MARTPIEPHEGERTAQERREAQETANRERREAIENAERERNEALAKASPEERREMQAKANQERREALERGETSDRGVPGEMTRPSLEATLGPAARGANMTPEAAEAAAERAAEVTPDPVAAKTEVFPDEPNMFVGIHSPREPLVGPGWEPAVLSPEAALDSPDEATVSMVFPKYMVLTDDINRRIGFPAGLVNVPIHLADHWYLRAHGVLRQEEAQKRARVLRS
jgi:hypothetical protein